MGSETLPSLAIVLGGLWIFWIDLDQECIYFMGSEKLPSTFLYLMGSETLPSAGYILLDESSIPFYSTSNAWLDRLG